MTSTTRSANSSFLPACPRNDLNDQECKKYVFAGIFPEMTSTSRSAKSTFLPSFPLLERLAEKCEDQCKVLKIHVDKNPMISNHHGVQGENPDSETLTSEEEQRIIQEQLKNLGYL